MINDRIKTKESQENYKYETFFIYSTSKFEGHPELPKQKQ